MEVKKDRVLLVKLGSLGDVLLTTPLIFILKSNFPNIQVDYLTSHSCAPLLKNNLSVSKILEVEEISTSRNIFNEAFKTLKLFFLLLKCNYEMVFVLHRSVLLDFILRVVAGNNIYSFYTGPWFKYLLKNYVRFDLAKHRILRNLDLVKVAFPDIQYSDEDLLLKFNFNIDGDNFSLQPNSYVVIAPGGGKNVWAEMPNRRWPLNKYIELARRINETLKLKIVFIGGRGEEFIIPEELGNDSSGNFMNLIGQTSLSQLATLMKNAALFIGNDSFPLFLAAAVGTKTVGIYGPTDSNLINPFGENYLAIQSKVKCSPCYNPTEGLKGKAYVCQKNECLQDISVVEVFESVISKLQATNY
jgi:heptosyltransferase-2